MASAMAQHCWSQAWLRCNITLNDKFHAKDKGQSQGQANVKPRINQHKFLHGFANLLLSQCNMRGQLFETLSTRKSRCMLGSLTSLRRKHSLWPNPAISAMLNNSEGRKHHATYTNGYHDQANNHVIDMFELSPASGSRRPHLPWALDGLLHHVQEAAQTKRHTWH